MTDRQPPPPPGLCRTCGASRKACDRIREQRDRACCHLCAHVHDTNPELGPGSEDW